MEHNITFKFNETTYNINSNTEYNCSVHTTSTNFTPLMYLVSKARKLNCNSKLKEYILTHKDELNKQNTKGWTALMIACRNSNSESTESTVKMLIDAGADLNLKNVIGSTALILALEYSDENSSVNTVKLLIDAGADLNYTNNKNSTALIMAIRYIKNISVKEIVVKMLITAGADINIKDTFEHTALLYAINSLHCSTKTIELLINAGADINTHDGKKTAIIIACQHHCFHDMEDKIKLLLDAKVDLTSTYNNKSGLEYLCQYTNEEIINYCFTKYNYDEVLLIKCIKITHYQKTLTRLLSNLYYEKVNHFKLYCKN